MPLLALVPTLPEPVVMVTPANDDAEGRPAPNARRRLASADARTAVPEPRMEPTPVRRLASVA